MPAWAGSAEWAGNQRLGEAGEHAESALKNELLSQGMGKRDILICWAGEAEEKIAVKINGRMRSAGHIPSRCTRRDVGW